MKRTHCPQGHPYSTANTLHNSAREPYRRCRACKKARNKARSDARKAATASSTGSRVARAIKQEARLDALLGKVDFVESSTGQHSELVDPIEPSTANDYDNAF